MKSESTIRRLAQQLEKLAKNNTLASDHQLAATDMAWVLRWVLGSSCNPLPTIQRWAKDGTTSNISCNEKTASFAKNLSYKVPTDRK
jgi:hypothetical protein